MKVLVSITNTGHNISKLVAAAACRLAMDRRVSVIFPTHTPYENNLHHVVKDFVSGPYEYWLNMDSDNPPMRNPLDLIDHKLNIVGLPTPVWHNNVKTRKPGERPYYWNAYDYVPEEDAYREHECKESLQRVDAVGTGCVLIHRNVFDVPEMRKAPFQRTYNEDGTVNKGNDLAFCERAREQGFKIWCHYGYPCRHFGSLEINEVVDAFANLYELAPVQAASHVLQ